MSNINFGKFINRRMIEYQARLERRVTVTEFAELLGVYQGDLSHWLKGRRLPGLSVVRRLSENPLIGPDVWEAAGYVIPLPDDPVLVRVIGALSQLPPELRKHYADEIETAAAQNQITEGQARFQFQQA